MNNKGLTLFDILWIGGIVLLLLTTFAKSNYVKQILHDGLKPTISRIWNGK